MPLETEESMRVLRNFKIKPKTKQTDKSLMLEKYCPCDYVSLETSYLS